MKNDILDFNEHFESLLNFELFNIKIGDKLNNDNLMYEVVENTTMVESERYDSGEPYTKIFLTNVPFPVNTDMSLDELHKLIEDASKN